MEMSASESINSIMTTSKAACERVAVDQSATLLGLIQIGLVIQLLSSGS